MTATAYLSHPACRLHDMGTFHPEQPLRMDAIEQALKTQGLFEQLSPYEAPQVTETQVCRVHTPEHYAVVAEALDDGMYRKLDPDTTQMMFTNEAALHAAGAVVKATELVVSGEMQRAFCNVRPPGHHALPHKAMGFCFWNNVAIGAMHALEALGLERVAICDFDVHHGNGTEAMFIHEPRVLFCSSFQHPFYPNTGLMPASLQAKHPHIVQSPLDGGTRSADFRMIIEDEWLPVLEAFEPQLLFISAGFDAHAEDQLASVNLQDEDYAWVTEQILAATQDTAQGRVVSTLEGGYALNALGRSAAAHIKVLLEF